MTLRSTLLCSGLASALAATMLAPAPAMARERAQHDLDRAARQLSDPALQGALATALASISAAMLDIPVAPFARAMDPLGDDEEADSIPPDATLGDMLGPEAEDMPGRLSQRVPRAMNGMAAMAGTFGDMLPRLEEIGRQVRRSMPRP